MPIRDVAAMNASLDNDYGDTRGPNAPASHDLALFIGDPMTDGVEVDGGGYARVTILPSNWAAAADGMKSLTAPAEFPAPTGAWPSSPTHWALRGADGIWWDCGALAEPLDVTEASPWGPLVDVTIFFDDAVMEAKLMLTYMEGFDLDVLMAGWSAFSDSGFENGSWGGRAFWAGNSSAGVARYQEFDWTAAGQPALAAGYVGWRGAYTGIPTNAQFAQLQESGITTHLALRKNASGFLELVRGDGTVLGATTSVVDITVWRHYAITFTIGDGTSGSAKVKVDDQTVINVTGVDTRNSASGTGVINKMHWNTGGAGNVFVRVDDYYHGNTTGAAPYNEAPGDRRVETLRPNGNGATSQWVGSDGNSVDNYVHIDDANSTADYIESATTGQRDLVTLTDLYVPASGTVQVDAVQEAVYAAKSDTGTAKDLLGVLRDADGTVQTETLADDLALTTSYAWFKGAINTLDPDGVAWTPSAVNALQAGVEVGA